MFDKFLFFKTPMCPNCEEIQEWLEEHQNIASMGEEVDATTKEGLDKAKQYGVSGVPTIVFFKGGEQVTTAQSLEEFQKVTENKSLGDFGE